MKFWPNKTQALGLIDGLGRANTELMSCSEKALISGTALPVFIVPMIFFFFLHKIIVSNQ